jgi:arylsulfatase A-like enzyme
MADRPRNPGAPNILLVVVDDQRYDTVGALGCCAIRTPTLDRLVERGTAFTQAHIPGGTVPAVCMPSRAMLHTGRSLFGIADAGVMVPADHVLLGEHLRAHGYRTWATGKWHNGPEAFNRSFERGEDIFFGGMSDHWNVPLCRYDPSGHYASRLPIVPDFMASNAVLERIGDHAYPGRHSTEIFADAAVEFLKHHDRSGPFFLSLAFMAPHDPRTMPARYRDLYDPREIELDPGFLPGHPFDNGELAIRDEQLAPFPRTEASLRRHVAEYYAMITHMDAELGRVLAELEWQGLAADTVVIFVADHGLALGRHGLMGKQSVYDHSVRVPLLMCGPGIPRGERRHTPVLVSDLYPTVCDLAEVAVPPSVQARSLAPILADPAAPGRDSLYLAYSSLHRGLKHGGFKLIEYVVGGGRMTQLFDLARDPWERENLAGRAGYQETLARLREELLRQRDSSGDLATPWGAAFWQGYENPVSAPSGLSAHSRLRDILDDPAGRAAFEEQLPELPGTARLETALDFPLQYLAERHPELFTDVRVAAIVAALERHPVS